ncbi:MAG: glycosyltransferase [Candidatus Marinimicrobia bacterium]|nr:glycosyltransferase [Candidatus Neomarinimicrobiota bacterium]
MPKITVIIPTQNRRKSLNRAIQSVLVQTFSDLELLIVNDSNSIINPIDDERAKIISNEGAKGANGSRNTGIKYAVGDYIAFLDDDDHWLSEKLFHQFNIMKKEESILSFTGKNIFRDDIFKKYSFRDSSKWMLNFYNFIGTTSTVIIKRDALQTVNGFDESISQLQDYELFLRLRRIGKFSGINRPLINYYMDTSNEHVSINWANFFSSSYKIWIKQQGISLLLFPIGILITFLQKTKNAID